MRGFFRVGPAGDAGNVAGDAVGMPRINEIIIPEKPEKHANNYSGNPASVRIIVMPMVVRATRK